MGEILKSDGAKGINFSTEPLHTGGDTWNNGNNVLFEYGVTKKISGYGQGLGQAAVTPEVIVPLRDDNGTNYWWGYVGDDEGTWKMYRITSKDSHDDATPDDAITEWPKSSYKWTGDVVNGVPYMTYGVPYKWDASSSKFKVFENIPRHTSSTPGDNLGSPRVRFKSIRTYRNFLIGMNFYTDDYPGAPSVGWGPWNEQPNPNGVWWSHSIIGKNIDVSWKDAEPLDFSGWNYLGGAGGPLVDGKVLRDSFILYRESSVWQMTYTGGVNVMAFKELFNDSGALSLDCVVEIEGKHLVVGQSDVYMHNGVSKQSVANGKIRKELFRRIDPAYTANVFVVADYQNKQAWVCIPEKQKEGYVQGSCNTAFVYNWSEDSWSVRDIPNITTSKYTILDAPEEDISWDAPSEGGPVDGNGVGIIIPGGTWEETDDTWNDSDFKYNPSEWGVAMGSRDGNIYTNIKDQMFDGTNFEGFVSKTYMDMGDRYVTKNITRIVPLVRGVGSVKIYGATSRFVDEGINWVFLGNFDPHTDEHLACRMSGRYFSIKFEIPEESRVEVKGYHIEYGEMGRR